jgi:hypothetical protein
MVIRYLPRSLGLLVIVATCCAQRLEGVRDNSPAVGVDTLCCMHTSALDAQRPAMLVDAWTRPDPEVIRHAAEQFRALGPARYGVARGDEWRNPSITVYRDGMVVTPKARDRATDRRVALRDLPTALSSLSRDAWPQGWWIELGPASLGAIGDSRETRARADEVRLLLEELGLQVNEPGL